MNIVKFPGLIDPHVHLRTPGQEYKEDFYSGTAAALAGGFTTIIDMPNNVEPITSQDRLSDKKSSAEKQVVCDLGFYFGSLGDNFEEFLKVQDKVLGLKIFLNQTTGGYVVNEETFTKICDAWPNNLPILLHAEEDILERALTIGHNYHQKIHVCHVSSQKELEIVIQAKANNWQVTTGVTPHHLFLSTEDSGRLEDFGKVKPFIKSKKDVDFLWEYLDAIDVIESDHAPHTKEEKQSDNPPFGLPGLETTLPLLLTAVSQGKLSLDEVLRLCHKGPKYIFSLNQDLETYIEVDLDEEWEIQNERLFTKCKWSPFNGWQVVGKVQKVVLHGKKVFENDKILVEKGFGRILP